ncbi:protein MICRORCHIDIA 7 [Vigna unguiculata]|uniref:Histidine kinase-like ATPase n=1 Tax=Vigna unguiculata TaxID=3917 RepID=A0A4D6L8Y4_VIGUN|nr:protein MICRORCHIDIA 7 [Vigna unguiculata]QCD84991.1 Histidine kinase-like ATPase [Vigna unguiculata]
MDVCVKEEVSETPTVTQRKPRTGAVSVPPPDSVIELSSSDSDSESDIDLDDVVASALQDGGSPSKKPKTDSGAVLPVGFLSPLPPAPASPPASLLALPAPEWASISASLSKDYSGPGVNSCKQFWKAGDYDGAVCGGSGSSTVGMDHVRVHPKFLHSNATSHKWALGAFAELLDNSLDEVCNGATYVNVDMLINKKDGSRMLLIEDNGGGMDPDKMRQCMSLGYSVKSKIANTIGQYGNGFKTSTMRLGADVIVFSRFPGKDGTSSTQSIGLLSYTFLRSTGKEDIVVPMLDYERRGRQWNKIIRTTLDDWNKNVETMVQWSPFSDEADLLRQFNLVKDHGTRVIIYNLWEDDQGQLELDFDADPHDIQIRGVNRDEKNIQMAKEFPNSRHFLTYRHSLRSYASILYLRLPSGFRIILRGEDILHHNIVNDMMMSQEVTYKPQAGVDGLLPKDSYMVAVVTIGFVKDAVHHVDVSGFNVYHKNRLIKPFWRIWNPAGSGGRGVIGVLEANFVEPAHDKQGFERTLVLSRLESKLIQMQKKYWGTNCHKIGYASNRNKIQIRDSGDKDTTPEYVPEPSQSKRKYSTMDGKVTPSTSDKLHSQPNQKRMQKETERESAFNNKRMQKQTEKDSAFINGRSPVSPPKHIIQSSSEESSSDDDLSEDLLPKRTKKTSAAEKSFENENGGTTSNRKASQYTRASASKIKGKDVNNGEQPLSDNGLLTLEQLKKENRELKERLQRKEEEILEVSQALLHDQDKCKSLETQLNESEKKIEELNRDQETLIDVFSEERDRRDAEEKNLRKKLQEASNTIQELLDKIRVLEKKSTSGKLER